MNRRAAVLALAWLVALAGCGQPQAQRQSGTSPTGLRPVTGAFPVTIKSCDQDLTLDRAPRRVLTIHATGLSAMHELDVIDRLSAQVGPTDLSVLDDSLRQKLAKVPRIEGARTPTGGVKISTEAILEQRVELVIGFPGAVDSDALAKAGIKLYTPDAYCDGKGTHTGTASFDWVHDEVAKMAQIFGVQDRVGQVKTKLTQQLPRSSDKNLGTAAAVYVTPGVQKLWVYGPSAMIHPIMAVNGLTNVYGDQEQRVPEMSVEDVIRRNPRTVIVLHGEGSAEEAVKTFTSLKGVSSMAAVRNERVVVLPYALTDPPSPSSFKGAGELAKALARIG